MVRVSISADTGGITSPAPGVYEYEAGSTITVTAIPHSGHVFDCWIVNTRVSGEWWSNNPLVLTVNMDTDIIAFFDPPAPGKAKLTIKVDPPEAGTTTPSPGEREFDKGSFVEVVARPYSYIPQYGFDHWSLNGMTLIVNPAYFKMNRDYVLTAHFGYGWLEVHYYEDNREVGTSVSVRDEGGTIVASGVTPFKTTLPPGRYRVIGPYEVTAVIESGKTTVVNFYYPPPGSGRLEGYAYADSYEVNADVLIDGVERRTTPFFTYLAAGTHTVRAEYGGQVQEKTVTIVAGGVTTVKFQFALPYEVVKLTIREATGGMTNPPPGTYDFVKGDTVTIRAAPYEGYSFVHYMVDGEKRIENPITITLDKDTTVTPYFRPIAPPGISPTLILVGIGLVTVAVGAIAYYASKR